MQKRDNYIDVIKSIAIIFVVSIHIIAPLIISTEILSFDWFLLAIYRSIVAPAVPLFFMCTGAILMKKKKNIGFSEVFKKYLPRLITALLFWAIVYEFIKVVYICQTSPLPNIDNILLGLRNILVFNHNYQLYFIYNMIVFYLFLPLIKSFIAKASKKDIEIAIIIWLIFGVIIPDIRTSFIGSYFINLVAYVYMPLAYSSIGCGLLAYYISVYPRSSKHYFSALIFGNLISFFLTYYFTVYFGNTYTNFWGGTSIGVIISAYGLFGLVKVLDLKSYSSTFYLKLAKASFGIFLAHDIILKGFKYLGVSPSQFPLIISVPIFTAIVVFITYLLYLILSKMGKFGKYIV